MKVEHFIAKRISRSKQTSKQTKTMINIAVASIVISVVVMIVALAVLTGFQKQIRQKVSGFGSHIQITKFGNKSILELDSLSSKQDFLPGLKSNPDIKNIQVFATKAGIIKTDNQIQGAVLKGVGGDFDWEFFQTNMKSGSIPNYSDSVANDDIIISKSLADLLKLKVGEPLRMYFVIDNAIRARKFNIVGIYNTGLTEFDIKYIVCDIKHIQKLNGWEPDVVCGFEIQVKNFRNIDKISEQVYESVGYDLNVVSIKKIYPQIFDWLNLQDLNVLIISVLMTIVSVMALISTLLILILDRTQMIGILKAIGARNRVIRNIFIYNATYIITKGVAIGNIIGITLCLVQHKFKLIKLPEESYFMNFVPININIYSILLINVLIISVCVLILLIPSQIISRITPTKALKLD